MNNFLANLGSSDLAGAFGLSEPGDKFTAEITPTGKQVFKQVTDGGKNKKAMVVNKNTTQLYQSLPNKKK